MGATTEPPQAKPGSVVPAASSTQQSQLPAPDIAATGPLLAADSRFFRDARTGRTILLRGVNLSGSTKQPFSPKLPSHEPSGFFEHTDVSFVGRPFPLDEADEHFSRLASWGFNFLRFNITWEAIEHAGPGIYDQAYIAYAKEYGFRVFIDPHQDVWSRLSGGSGAPGWTLDVVGFEPRNFAPTNAALVQNTYADPKHFPKMIWSTNYFKLATATMFTLFFAGRTFAPKCTVGGVNIQDYLQQHYANAVAALARAIHSTPGLENDVVLGYDTLNEPSGGYIDCKDINVLLHEQEMRNGLTPTPLQGMILGEGKACPDVQVWEVTGFGPQRVGSQTVDPAGVRAWKDGVQCIWATHGVWDPQTGKALIMDYFSKDPSTSKPFDFLADGWQPFVRFFSKTLRAIHSDAVIFVEPPVNVYPPKFDVGKGDPSGPLCYAPHWYDGLTLVTKTFNTWYNVDYIGFKRGKYSSIAFAIRLGEAGIRSAFKSQLNMIRQEGVQQMGLYPCVIGEIGIPYDMDDKKAYLTGDYASQTKAMDANMSALERNLLNFTLWNYCSDNSNLWGDQWNGEDLSLWSPPVASVVAKELGMGGTGNGTGTDGSGTRSSYESGDTLSNDPVGAGGVKASSGIVSRRKNVPADLNQGARALEAFVRPFPVLTPGTPVALAFDLDQVLFTYTFSHSVNADTGLWHLDSSSSDALYTGPDGSQVPLGSVTELYIPHVHFPTGSMLQVWVSDGTWRLYGDLQRCVWKCACRLAPQGGQGHAHGHDATQGRSGSFSVAGPGDIPMSPTSGGAGGVSGASGPESAMDQCKRGIGVGHRRGVDSGHDCRGERECRRRGQRPDGWIGDRSQPRTGAWVRRRRGGWGRMPQCTVM
ncbi:glycoside hydrolase superfamily [Entophlyctis helioformis]|nr:glycoside hydrolase superfamily [Entophlyctis helioformis]